MKFFVGSLHFPQGSSPLVSKVAVYSGQSVEDAVTPELPISCYQGQLYLKRADVLRDNSQTKGLQVILTASKLRQISYIRMVKYDLLLC